MEIKSVLNFRDLGGNLTIDNKKIRNGVIFRSANPDNISKDDINKFYLLNIRTIIDLRALHECKKLRRLIDNIDHLSIPMDFNHIMREKLKPFLYKRNSEDIIAEISNSLYLDILDAVGPLFKQIMEVLVSSDRCPVLIHCQAGKDRTGIVCALILLALGTERHFIIEDYLKSNDALLPYFKKMLLIRKILSFGFFPSRRVLFAITVRQRNIESVLDRIADHYGGIESYLKYSGFDLSSLPELRSNLCTE
jgi:protein-tyrosine phosphatase